MPTGEACALEAALTDARLLPESLLKRAKRVGAETQTPLIASITRLGLLGEDSLAQWLAGYTDTQRWTPGSEQGAPKLPKDANLTFLKAKRALFLSTANKTWRIVVTDPTDTGLIAALQFILHSDAEVLIGTEADILTGLSEYKEAEQHAASIDSAIDDANHSIYDGDVSLLKDLNSDAPAIQAVNKIISDACECHASDIHIEPMERSVVVRYRSDGVLREMMSLPQAMAGAIVSRVKVMASLDIAEKRLPQDGRIRTSIRGQNVDLRVSTSPTIHGESLVMRVLGRSTKPLNLDDLGLSNTSIAHFSDVLARPNGIVLVTGPTGSGKTTTLYAALNQLKIPNMKILTVEDPVEYLIPGINQVQVKPDIGLTYAKALRAFLRQDPDVMMVGEIRDKQTADIAIRAALTGHLVLSTLHTNSALGAVTRLIDMGIEPFLIASTLTLTAGQRLVRKLCMTCRTKRSLSAEERRLFQAHLSFVPQHIYSQGCCASCDQSGFNGRVPIIETVRVNTALANMIRGGSDEAEMRDMITTSGNPTLFADGLARVAQGVTTLSEVKRAALGSVE